MIKSKTGLAYVVPCVLEHLQPWAGFAGELIIGLVAHLHGAEAGVRGAAS